MDSHDDLLAECQQAESGLPEYGADSLKATWNARVFDRTRHDESYRAFDDSVRLAFFGEFKPRVLRAIERHSRDDIDAACAEGSAWLVAVYTKAHGVGGSQHINSPEEEISTWTRKLAQRCWRAPEQAVLVLFLHAGEHIVEIDFDQITTDRNRTLLRADLPSLTGQPAENFTSEAAVEKAMVDEARDAEAARHAPWSSNHFVGRSGRRYHLGDVPADER